MADISTAFHRLEDKFDRLLSRNANVQGRQLQEEEQTLSAIGHLPIELDEHFLLLNRHIRESSQFRHSLVNILASVGGRDVRIMVLNVMKKLIDDGLAESYSLTGKQMKNSSKKSFLAADVSNVIFSACQRVYPTATEVEMKEAMSDWLNQAKVRRMRKLQRLQRRAEENM